MGLVLARQLNESIVIGPDVRVTVVALRPGVVKLHVEAPAGVRVDRDEVARRIARGDAPPRKDGR